jgi:DNA-binding beta-propeller fold protein YncE
VYAVAVDSHDHAWLLQSPKGGWPAENLLGPRIAAAGKRPAPNVIEFDTDGTAVRGWGGPAPDYSWMDVSTAVFPFGSPAEHGIFVDYKDNVWVTGNGHVALKFTPAGKFLLQIGQLWRSNGSNDRRLLGNPTDIAVDPTTNEVYIADGYVNHRVIVFDADTGAYKRHWGAYGKKPEDGPPVNFDPNSPPPTQLYPVHCVKVSKDGLVYVCDRQRNRVQVFQRNGTFVKEVFIAKDTKAEWGVIRVEGRADDQGKPYGYGAVSTVAFSADPQQRYLYVGDFVNRKTWIVRRSDLQLLGSFGKGGHEISTDSKGNVYTGTERYFFKGISTTSHQ